MFRNLLISLGLLVVVTVNGPLAAQTTVNNLTNTARLAEDTVANRPSGTDWTGRMYVVTDGATGSDCTTGGGSNRVLCYYNGSTWASLVSGVGGGAPTDAQYLTNQAEAGLSAEVVVSNEAQLESALGAINVLVSTELDAEAELEALLVGVTNVFTNNDGALADDDLSNDTIGALSGVTITSWSAGEVLRYSGTALVDAQLGFSDLSGAATDAQVPNNITVDLATAATALAANGGNCAAGLFPLGMDASGAAESCTDPLLETELDAIAELQAQIADATLLTTADEGSGNGIDADTVDGIEEAALLRIDGTRAMTGQLQAHTDGVYFNDSDIVPTCGASDFWIRADTSENVLKKCQNGVETVMDTTGGTPAFSDITGATNTTAAMVVGAGASLRSTAGILGFPGSITLPLSCTVNDVYIDTDATSGQRFYLCETTDNWVLQGDGGGAETNSLETTITGILDTEVFIGTGANTGNFAAISGDATLANTGALSLIAGITRDTEWDTAAEINAATTDDDFPTLTGNNIFTGNNTFGVPSNTFLTVEGATNDAIETFFVVVDPTTTDKTITFPNATGTVSLLTNTETLTNKTISGDSNTLSANTHATDCTAESGSVAGQICHELDDDTFWVYDGVAWDQIGAGGAEVNNLETTDPPNVLDNEVYVGTGAGAGAWTALNTNGAVSFNGTAFAQADLTNLASSTSANLLSLLSDETGTGVAVFGTNPTLTDVTVNDLITFTETVGDATCAAGDYWLKGNSTTGKVRGCENGTLFDANTAGGAYTFDLSGDTGTDETVDNGNIAHFAGGDGIATSVAATDTLTIVTASEEANFLNDGGAVNLTCGAAAQGKAQVMDAGTLQFCDGATTSVLQTTALGASDGDALAGDNATNFFDAGNLELARLPVGTANQLIKTNAGATAQEHATLAAEAGNEINVAFGAGTITLDVNEANLDLAAIGGTLGTGQADADFLLASEQGIGTDVTADLEEEAHASEHTAGGTDIITVDGTDAGAATTRTNENAIQISRHNTDCTSLTDGVAGELCHEEDADDLYICEPTAGGCDTAGEWILLTSAGGGMTSFNIDGDNNSPQTITNGNEALFVGGSGIVTTAAVTDQVTIATASEEADFLNDGGAVSLTCGASTQGKMQVVDSASVLEFCDGQTTPVLQTIPAEAGYVVVNSGAEETAANPFVTNRRIFAANNGIQFSDAGAGGNLTVQLRWDANLATPALNPPGVGTCLLSNGDGAAEGFGSFICEGTADDTNQQQYAFPSSNGADTTEYFAVGALTDDTVLVADGSDYANATLPDSDGATQKLQYDQATNTFSAGTDDDVPEAGDFAAATDLDLNGAINTGAVGATELADAYHTRKASISLPDPATGDSGKIQFEIPSAATLTEVACNVDAATNVVIQLYERARATPETGTTGMLTSNLTCVTGGAATTAFADSAVAADVPVALGIVSVSGTPTWLRVHVKYRLD